ncbi:trehalase isoform X2 [Halyomorpha halys]|uniref:trehalase isoform X2 n=1 Tax=Halyomorpha halys TaxID=286706 RepID=UPI0006D5005F|nr:trehalase isoform X2 [Halyomorpha halys]
MHRCKSHLMPTFKKLLGNKELSMTCIQNVKGENTPESWNSPRGDHRGQVLKKLMYQATRYDVFCRGHLLDVVQMAALYQDSKTFVDKKMKYPAAMILENFERFYDESEGIPERELIRGFVDSNFEVANELENYEPPDWVPYPSILKDIADVHLRNWASELNSIWKNLTRKHTSEVVKSPELFSSIVVPNGFVVPGGRFSELYYWDTYWIINGLLICDMIRTARGMVENLLHLVATIGHVPNGGRIYYEERTQPPLLTQMVESYYKYSFDFDFIASNINLLDKEMDFWTRTRTVRIMKHGVHYVLYRYYAADPGPRPESYREDVHSAIMAQDAKKKQERYTSIKTAAESGWDFSTRWFILNGENKGNLSNMQTHQIVPVDLNAFMHKNFSLLHIWYEKLRNKGMARKYKIMATELLTAIENVLWDEEDGIWQDYDLKNDISRDYFYMSNFAPLWTKSYTFHPQKITNNIINYMVKYNLDRYTGGFPSSTEYSGEQWDFPNAWPPLQAFLIQGLDRIGTYEASEVAFYFADKYIHSNYKGFKELGVMFEKSHLE